jgi:acetyltransferase-like isoleucine patch superfamily enzyme
LECFSGDDRSGLAGILFWAPDRHVSSEAVQIDANHFCEYCVELLKKFHNRIRADGLWFGSLLLFYRAARVIRSKLYGFLFNAKNLDIGIGCHIKGVRHITFGTQVSIFRNGWLEAVTRHNGQDYQPRIQIGDRTSFSNNVHVSCIDRITFGRDVLIGSNVHISDHNHGTYHGDHPSLPGIAPALRELGTSGPVIIGDNVWICDNVVIIGPTHIGDGAVIGANSVVRGNIPARTVAAGAPARVVKQFDSNIGQWVKPCRADDGIG